MTGHKGVADFVRGLVKPAAAPAPKKDAAVLDSAANYAEQDIAIRAVASVRQWAEVKPADLGDGETLADRLLALLVGIADENHDGEITDDEADILSVAANAAADFLAGLGVSDDDIVALLEDFEVNAAERVHELIADGAGDGDYDDSEIDAFVFDSDATEAALDSTLDAVYKKRIVVRRGKKVRINKRVAGVVRLTAAQKVGIRKARMKSHNAAAVMRRMRSMRKRVQLGLKSHPAT